MKKWIIALVLLAHVGGLAWFLLRNRGAEPAPAPEAAAASQAQPPPPPPELTMARFALGVAPAAPLPAKLAPLAQDCRTGILVDLGSRQILWQKSPDQPAAIASMTKMMTALLAMEAIHKEKRLDYATRIPVTPTAAKIGGSQVWLDPKEIFTAEELLKCVMIKSANDASHLLAEHLGGGDAAAFVAAMNRRAQELGCPGMKFYNAHGLPPARNAPENEATARELALLAARLLEYPDLMRISAIKMDWIRKDTPKPTELFNHNTLISRLNCPGVDGLKTGLTNKAGNCVTATCLRNGRRLIAVATGCSTAKNRDRLVAGLFDWGYQQPPAAAPAAKATPPAARQPGHGG